MAMEWRNHIRSLKPIPLFSWSINMRIFHPTNREAHRLAAKADHLLNIDRSGYSGPHILARLFTHLNNHALAAECRAIADSIRIQAIYTPQSPRHRFLTNTYPPELAATQAEIDSFRDPEHFNLTEHSDTNHAS